MAEPLNLGIVLAASPHGWPTASDFRLAEAPCPP